MFEERSGESTHHTKTLETVPVGSPRIHMAPHHDGLGWLVTVDQQVERTDRKQTSQNWTGRRYVFSPFSLLAGLVQCPMGVFHLLTTNPSNNAFRFGCSRLLMLEPLDGTIALPPTISTTDQTQTSWEPLNHGVVQLIWQQTHSRVVTYTLSEQGRTDIRLSHALSVLLAANDALPLEQNHTLLVRVRYGEALSVQQPLPVTSQHIRSARRVIPATLASDKWPVPLVLHIQIDRSTMSAEEGEFIRDRLAGWALHRQLCIVAAERLHPPLFDEHRIQYSGGVDEREQVQLGRLLPASVVLTVSISESRESTATVRHMALQISTVREGQVLGTAYGSSRSQSTLHILERALTELEVILANAPRGGCPVRPVSYTVQ